MKNYQRDFKLFDTVIEIDCISIVCFRPLCMQQKSRRVAFCAIQITNLMQTSVSGEPITLFRRGLLVFFLIAKLKHITLLRYLHMNWQFCFHNIEHLSVCMFSHFLFIYFLGEHPDNRKSKKK